MLFKSVKDVKQYITDHGADAEDESFFYVEQD